MGVRNLPKVLTRQRPGRESNPVSAIHKSDALPVSHRATQTLFCIAVLICQGNICYHLSIRYDREQLFSTIMKVVMCNYVYFLYITVIFNYSTYLLVDCDDEFFLPFTGSTQDL